MAEQLQGSQARRRFFRIATAVGLSALIAGCQFVPGGRPERRGPQPDARQPGAARSVPRVPNQVAVLVPLTGGNAGVGKSIANAADLALLDSGGAGVVKLTVYDTGKGAQAAARQALAEGNRLFLGPLLAEDAQAVAPIARAARVPVISFSNDVSVAGNGVYVMGFNPDQSIARVVGHARGQNMRRLAGLVPENVYGARSSQALTQAVARVGGRLVGIQGYDGRPQSLRSAVNRLNAQGGYDAVLIADGGRTAAAAASLIRGGASKGAKILGSELWRTDASITQHPALRGAWFASVPDTMFNQLRTRYRARYGVNPYRLGSLGYDAVLLAVRIGRGWRAGRPFPEHELTSDEGFAGVDGAFRFNRNGVAQRALEVQEVRAGGLTTVSPAPQGFR